MKKIKSLQKRVRAFISYYDEVVGNIEQCMRDGCDPIDFESLRVTLADMRTIEWILNEIVDRSKQKSHHEADDGDDDH